MSLLTALLLATAVPPTSASLAPSGKWEVDYGDNSCMLARPFGSSPNEVLLGITWTPYADIYTVTLDAPGPPVTRRNDQVRITLDGKPPLNEPRWTMLVPRAGMHRLAFAVTTELFTNSTDQSTLTIKEPGGATVSLRLERLKAGISALTACTRDLASKWGVDPAQDARIMKAAVPIGDELNWVTPDDYPLTAFNNGHQGKVGIVWAIHADGTAGECRVVVSSGYADLDNGTCEPLMRRARYAPARDASGAPVASTGHRTINWTNPNVWAVSPKAPDARDAKR